MEKTYFYSRKIRVPLEDIADGGYNAVEYNHSITVTYNEGDFETLTIIDDNEFKELHEKVDEIQRKIIKKELGIKKLPMDKQLETKETVKTWEKNTPSFRKKIIKK
jgi:hypothetical protein